MNNGISTDNLDALMNNCIQTLNLNTSTFKNLPDLKEH
jgi:hypothetical protein